MSYAIHSLLSSAVLFLTMTIFFSPLILYPSETISLYLSLSHKRFRHTQLKSSTLTPRLALQHLYLWSTRIVLIVSLFLSLFPFMFFIFPTVVNPSVPFVFFLYIPLLQPFILSFSQVECYTTKLISTKFRLVIQLNLMIF